MKRVNAESTPAMTPEQWRALSKADLWDGPFSDVGHCHNLLDEWAGEIERLRDENDRHRRAALVACVLHDPEFHTWWLDRVRDPAIRDEDVVPWELVARLHQRNGRLRGFVAWVLSQSEGEARRTVTLTQIVERARAALGDTDEPAEGDDEE